LAAATLGNIPNPASVPTQTVPSLSMNVFRVTVEGKPLL
jgi:hypothetical protein